MSDSPVRVFDSNDRPYFDWLRSHPNGFVMNTTRGISPDYMVLHRAKCTYISGNAAHQPGAFTERQYIKVCAADVTQLASWCKAQGRTDGTFSSTKCPCLRWTGS